MLRKRPLSTPFLSAPLTTYRRLGDRAGFEQRKTGLHVEDESAGKDEKGAVDRIGQQLCCTGRVRLFFLFRSCSFFFSFVLFFSFREADEQTTALREQPSVLQA